MRIGLINAQWQFPKAAVSHKRPFGYFCKLRAQSYTTLFKNSSSIAQQWQAVGAHLSVHKHGQGLAGAKPIPIAEVIHGVPTQGPILAPFQHQSMEESQDKQQPWPCLGLLGAALGKRCGGQGAKAA